MKYDTLINDYAGGPQLLREAVRGMSRDQLLAQALAEQVGDALRELSRVDEHERGVVVCDVTCDAVDDLVELCKPVARHGGLFSSHIRNEGTGVFDAVKEAITVGERAGVPVDIIHIKIADQKYWGRMDEIIALIEAALSRTAGTSRSGSPL